MSTEIFPLRPDQIYYPTTDKAMFRTIISPFESGKEQREKKWSKVKRAIMPKFDYEIGVDLIDEVYDFYIVRFGTWDSFWMKNPNGYEILNEAVGTGNGSETVFYLDNYPCDISSVKIYLNGILQTSGYTVTNDNTNKKAKITFSSPVGNGVIITASYEYYLVVRFLEDELTRTQYAYKLFQTGINMVELF